MTDRHTERSGAGSRRARFVAEEPEGRPRPLAARLGVSTSVTFTVVMLCTLVAGSLFAPPEAQAGIRMCWSILGASAAAAVLQAAFFSTSVAKRPMSAVRVGLFGGSLFGVLAVVAALAGWFPVGEAGAWAVFLLIYLVALAATTAAFGVSSRRRAREFDERLGAYRASHGRD